MRRAGTATQEVGAVVRFTPRARLEHAAVMTLFVLLALTGFPQKFFPAPWAQSTVDLMGGIDRVRWLHRAAGLSFALLFIVHVGGALWPTLRRRAALSLVPERKDFHDAAATLRFQLGEAAAPPPFDRFDYRQKFEYWGLLLGGAVMVATGLVLVFPLLATAVASGQLIPVSKVAHGNEGLMAFLVVVTWHVFNAHLSPESFPGDTSIFTGRISSDRLRHEHPLEAARLAAGEATPPLAGSPLVALATAPLRGAALVVYLPALGFVMVGRHLARAAARRLAGRFRGRSKAGEPPASAA